MKLKRANIFITTYLAVVLGLTMIILDTTM